MTLTQLKYVIAVADTRSMNEAARTLFLSQPSLSSAIRELEDYYEAQLFERTSRGLAATPAAVAISAPARV